MRGPGCAYQSLVMLTKCPRSLQVATYQNNPCDDAVHFRICTHIFVRKLVQLNSLVKLKIKC